MSESSKNERSVCVNAALGESTGKVTIPLQDKSTQNSLSKKRSGNNIGGLILEEIEVDTLDNFVLTHAIDRIDFLKIDTEGFEMEVLKGGLHFLKKGGTKFILLELGLKLHDRTTFYNRVQEHLTSLGYDVVGIYKQSQSLYTKSRFLMHADILFVNSEWSKTLKPGFVKSYDFE